MSRPADPRVAFIEAAIWHGGLEPAEAILAAHAEIAGSDIHTAAILGDDALVRRFLAEDPSNVSAKSPPHGGDALNYLCLSKYLRLDPARTPAFLRSATALLDAGADPNTGFWTTGQFPERETALYGAAGVAHHPEMTRLLLERGADPNDDEAATSVSVNVTFFDAAGGVVSSESEELSVILPGATNAVGDGVSETPGATRMEVQVLPGDWETLSDTGSFSVEGVRTVPQQYLGVKTTALVKSTFAKDLESMKATAIYYAADGAITAGPFTYVDFVPANGSVGIELSTFSRPAAFDRTDVFIEITSLTMLEAED